MATFRLKSLHAQNNIMNKLCADDSALEAEYARNKARGMDESHPDMQVLRTRIAEATRKSYEAFAKFKTIYDQDKPAFHGLHLNEVEEYHMAKVKFILGQIQVLPVTGGVAPEGDLRGLHRILREDLKQERQLLVKLLLRSAEAYEASQKDANERFNERKRGVKRLESVRKRDAPIGNIEHMMGELEEDLRLYFRNR
ncbi:hypothetical protein FKW77_007344 [Venturia effusa]|uniref:Uncharacterized protein n=1 Tax=Venturia effusa TaxID=50376 RepID=A0A517L3N6_9PEZI|nr:hypothetical protein FKW77_007344 [Venturia effusa]